MLNKDISVEFITPFMNSINSDPISKVLPPTIVKETTVNATWVYPSPTTMPLVRPGMPNNITKGTTASFNFQPAYCRKGWQSGEYSLTQAAESLSLIYGVLGTKLLQGSIDYTDPVSGVSIQLQSGIPERNKIKCTLKDVPIIIGELVKEHNKDIDLKDLIPTHKVILNPHTSVDLVSLNRPGVLKNGLGMAYSIAGIEAINLSSIYDDYCPKTNITTRKYMWETNKITLVLSYQDDPVGMLYLTKGENPNPDASGPWAREITQEDGQVAYQVGAAGLPVLRKPHRVFIIELVD